MMPEKRGPAARTGANRAGNIKTDGADFDRSESIADPLAFQSAFIANRYRLSLTFARIVCQLACIGGRLM